MNTVIVERIKQLADCIVNESVSPLVKNAEAIDQVLDFFSEFTCKAAYQEELLFRGLASVFGVERGAMLSGNFQDKAKDWQNAVLKQNELVKQHVIPVLFTNLAPQSSELVYYNTINFVLEEFSYGSVQIKEQDVVLDIGAGYGHTAFWAKSKNPKQVFSFETTPHIFEYLEKNVDDTDNIYACNLLFSNQKSKLNFNVPKGGVQETAEVDVTTLDSWCSEKNCKPHFIKIALENALQCLIGGQNVLQNYKPQLAIAVGKQTQEMWEIPLLLKNIVPDYRFYCRKNSPYGDFVLYAKSEKA